MFNLRNETIKAILTELKIDNNPFNTEIVREFIAHIHDSKLKEFYIALFKSDIKFYNGLDRVSKVAESFKTVEINPLEAEAEKLIELVKGMNASVYQTHIKTGIAFNTLIENVKFPSVSEDTIAILDNVKPYYSHKQLILRVNHYQTTKDALRAFMDAIKNKENNKNALELKKALKIKK